MTIRIVPSLFFTHTKRYRALFYEEDIYVASLDHTSVERANIKSKYIDRVKLPDEYNLTMEKICSIPKYGNLLYDTYRNVYYRIAYPETEIEKGETLFPDYTYNSTLMFIRRDGLYISAGHFMNPEFSDDVLLFHRFDLAKKE
jgi:hypothetical protein